MTPGDVVLIYNNGRIRVAGEIAAKVRNAELARYFWKENEAGSTWELMYFIVNEERADVPIERLNPLFGYQSHYHPQGFSMINDLAVSSFAQNYGDILGVLKTLEKGKQLIHVPARNEALNARIDEHIERMPTEHDEMQWRLIRLGQLARCDVWVPRSDQPRQYEGNQFRNFVLQEFHETLNVPRSIENIDVVWKFGPYSIKSAFEIEHSTSVYSGILRLSDLRAEAPNSNYPLFIVASEDRRRKVFEELSRPTFSGPCLRLNEVITPTTPDSRYCATCARAVSRENLLEVAKRGRVATVSVKAQASRSATQRRQAAALKAWKPSDKPGWLDEKTYRDKIQPRLKAITVPTILSALAVSEPYATNIRAARCVPHPRHWLTLARLVGLWPDE